MIISRTPYRISFFGGGTDYPAWYRQHGGAVLATSIDKYCYLTARFLPPFFEHKIRVVYSKIENCHDIDEIQHPAVREILRFLRFDRGVEIHHDGDLPARSGIGSSLVVLRRPAARALRAARPHAEQAAARAEGIHIEQDVLHETVGSQDQVTAAYGGFNQVLLPAERRDLGAARDDRARAHARARVAPAALLHRREAHLVGRGAELRPQPRRRSKRHLRIMKDLVDEAIGALERRRRSRGFGELLHESWLAKRSLSTQVSTAEVDEIYATAHGDGALGGKLLGAGGGGFLLLFARPDDHAALRAEARPPDPRAVPLRVGGLADHLLRPGDRVPGRRAARAPTVAPRVFRERGGLGSQ